MPGKKTRIQIPKPLAAQVLFESDRTCCVCHRRDKPTQIHHIDDDPSNNRIENLAVLCLECHEQTQLKGGFGRKLDAHQVILYRREWLSRVRAFRDSFAENNDASQGLSNRKDGEQTRLRRVMSMIELAREDNDWFRVASLYDMIGEIDLRDKYVAKALPEASPYYQVLLKHMQGRADELSDDTKQAALRDTADDSVNHFSVLNDIGNTREACLLGLDMVRESIEDGGWFAVAYTLKNRLLPIAKKLFLTALEECQENGDLWWELRCYDELGWHDAARDFVLSNEKQIRESDNLLLHQRLAAERGDEQEYAEVMKSIEIVNAGAYVILRPKGDGT